MTGELGRDLLVALIVALAGAMRGITGFGGAMLMTPPLGLLVGAVPAVVVSLFLEAAAALIMVPATYRDLPVREFARLIVPAALAIPFGTSVLVGLDPLTARRAIGCIVVASSLAMLTGLRYRRPAPIGLTLSIGTLAGSLLGATGIGAPPVILFLLSGPGSAAATRAILTAFISTTSFIGLAALAAGGALTLRLVLWSAGLTAVYLATLWLGMAAFSRLSEHGARTASLALMLVLGLMAMLA